MCLPPSFSLSVSPVKNKGSFGPSNQDGSDKKRQPSLGNGHQNNNERDLHQYGQMGSFKQPANSFHSHHESLAHQNQSQSLSRMLGMSQTQASQYSNGMNLSCLVLSFLKKKISNNKLEEERSHGRYCRFTCLALHDFNMAR